MKKIALFAADAVGLRIARFLREQEAPLACLVLDKQDKRGLNVQIVDAVGSDQVKIITTDRGTDLQLASRLAQHSPDLCVLAWWPYILKPEVIAIPTIGCLNFHPSLLPYGRGKSPNFWSLVEETPFGVTIHWVDEGVDSGDIAFQCEIPVSWEDTGKTLYLKSQDELIRLFQQHWPEIRSGEIPRTPQSDLFVSRYQHELDSASRIDLDEPSTGRTILNKLRARTFEPHPGAWFEVAGRRYEVRISISPIEEQTNDTRTIRRA